MEILKPLLTEIENLNQVASLSPITSNGRRIRYYVKTINVDTFNNDEHSNFTIKLNNPAMEHVNALDEDNNLMDTDAIYKRDSEVIYQHRIIHPSNVLPDYPDWRRILPTDNDDITIDGPATPIIYTTKNQDVFMITLTDHHIIYTIILSGMY